MTIENDAATGAADQNTPEESQQTPEVATPEEGQLQEERAAKPLTAEERLEKERANFQRRLNRKHHETAKAIAEAQAEARQLREQLERLAPKEESQEQRPPSREDIDRIANQRAEEIATAREVANRSNKAFEAGIKQFGETFRESVGAVIEDAGPLIQKNGLPTALGEAVLDAEDPAALLHYLGANPDDAESLRGLSAAQLGRRIARIEAQMAQASASKPPAPLKPVTPTGSTKKPDTEMSDADWWAAQQAKKRK